MDEAKASAQHQQQMLLHQQQQHHKQQQMIMQHQLQQLQQQRQNQQQQHPQQSAINRFPSNIDAHLRPLGMNRAIPSLSQSQNPNPNPNSTLHNHPQLQTPSANPNPVNPQPHQLNMQHSQQQQQQKLLGNRGLPAPSLPLSGNQAELQLAYQDAWRVCHPDYRRPFSSLEDVCERNTISFQQVMLIYRIEA